MYIPGFILILAVSVFGQLQDIPVEKCKCWVPTYNRVACNQYNPNMPQGQCESMGCCYHDSGLYTTPKCYRMTGRCPPQQCLIPASQRTVCITANLASTRCLNGQCCYDGGSAPHCYQSIGRQPVPRYDTSVRRSMFSDGGGENVPHMPKGYLRQGNAMLIVGGCERATLPCGTTKTTKEQCMRFMCCWMPSRKTPSGQTCFTSIYNFIKFPFAKWNNWGNWEACSTTTPCVTGTQNRRRTCENQKVNGPGCQGSDVESRACTTCTVSWGAWTAYGACVSAEPLCASGTQTRTRQCQNSAAVVQPSSSCTGVDTENQVCNANLCPTYTPWSGACSVTCGGGTQNRARTCTTTPAGPIPASCTAETGVACNTQSCNKDLDIMFIVDSSDQLDLCSTKESALSIIAPFASTNAALTSANFPNFIQQRTFLTTFLSTYKTVTTGRTYAGILARSGSCVAATATNYNRIKALSDPYVPLQAENSMNYLCGFPDFFSTLGCGIEYIKTGNTANPDVIVEILPDVTTLSSILLTTYRNNVASINTIAGNTRVLTVTAADLTLSKMTQANIDANILFGKQWACRSTTPSANCIYYLGSVYNPATVIANFMLATADL